MERHSMRRIPWGVLLALLVGVGLGLAYAWVLSPRRIADAQPLALRRDFKDQYRSVIAASYAATGNLPRAQARLSLLGDPDPIEALIAQAQRMRASSQTFERADLVAGLASALEEGTSGAPVSAATNRVANDGGNTFTPSPSGDDTPLDVAETPQPIETETAAIETQTPLSEATPRPTRTSTAEPGKPFALALQEPVCDRNLPEGLLQVIALNRSRRQLAGVEIVVTWDGGKEQFFTGLKPELGNGYADYIMTPDTTYTVKLARGSDVALGITPPTCQGPNGETFIGGVKLTFQQP
jgi:hypothetical protein